MLRRSLSGCGVRLGLRVRLLRRELHALLVNLALEVILHDGLGDEVASAREAVVLTAARQLLVETRLLRRVMLRNVLLDLIKI